MQKSPQSIFTVADIIFPQNITFISCSLKKISQCKILRQNEENLIPHHFYFLGEKKRIVRIKNLFYEPLYFTLVSLCAFIVVDSDKKQVARICIKRVKILFLADLIQRSFCRAVSF